MGSDGRPKLAVGHVSIEVDDVDGAYAFFVRHGMRDIFRGDNFGVLELRGGTHLVVSQARQAVEPGTGAPFDLMVDDIDAAHDDFTAAGVAATDIKRGRIHDTFHIDGPGGYRFAVTSSHAGDRVV
ncbi:MAG: VOC family protein [bacterium]|nr:VOC family protein [bacterium]